MREKRTNEEEKERKNNGKEKERYKYKAGKKEMKKWNEARMEGRKEEQYFF